MKRHHADIVADGAEAVDVRIADARPVDELDAEFERALRAFHEIDLVDLEHVVEYFQMRHGCFAHADGADFFRFDEPDRILAAQHLGTCRCRHPAGRAAADDHDVSYL